MHSTRNLPRALIIAALLCLPQAASWASPSCAKNICVDIVKSGREITFYGINKNAAMRVTVKFSIELEGMKIASGGLGPFVLEGGKKQRLFKLRRTSRGRWRYRYRYRWARGDYRAKHDDSHVYRLPYAAASRYAVMQGCNGKFSHFGPARFAIDFKMPRGAPIHAARGGRIVFVRSDSNVGGGDRAYIEYDNRVVIEHSDRTFGVYAHFMKDGVIVKLNQLVHAGDLIGHAGSTGFSTGPHLHFGVGRAAQDASDELTVPVTFETSDGKVRCPEPGSTYEPR